MNWSGFHTYIYVFSFHRIETQVSGVLFSKQTHIRMEQFIAKFYLHSQCQIVFLFHKQFYGKTYDVDLPNVDKRQQ